MCRFIWPQAKLEPFSLLAFKLITLNLEDHSLHPSKHIYLEIYYYHVIKSKTEIHLSIRKFSYRKKILINIGAWSPCLHHIFHIYAKHFKYAKGLRDKMSIFINYLLIQYFYFFKNNDNHGSEDDWSDRNYETLPSINLNSLFPYDF